MSPLFGGQNRLKNMVILPLFLRNCIETTKCKICPRKNILKNFHQYENFLIYISKSKHIRII